MGASEKLDLANASIEQIEAAALAAEEAGGNANAEAAPEADEFGSETAASTEAKQDVEQAPSGQPKEQEAGKKESDKELNFAKLRTKTEALERETQRLAEENKRLASQAYQVTLPADHAQKVSEVNARIADIGKKFQDGDITWEEHQSQLREADALRQDLTAQALKAQIAKEMQEQREQAQREAASKTWQESVESFIAKKPDAIDYSTDEAKSKDLDAYVKALAANPANADKSFDWFLNTAHTMVKTTHGVTGQAPAKQEGKPAIESPANTAAPINSLSDLPSGAPPAKNEAENLDSMSGAALANRYMNMTSAQIDAELAKLGM